MSEEAPQQKKIEAINYRLNGRFEAVLSQIISVGPPAYLTHKANVKADPTKNIKEQKYSQLNVWMNETDGIITLLKRHEAFEGCSFPSTYASVIQAVDRLLDSKKHLYTLARHGAGRARRCWHRGHEGRGAPNHPRASHH